MTSQPTAQNLPAWLETATRDLVPSAQARIRAEIEAHYADALQSHLASGASASAAPAAALADLGDAAAAARRFRQEHLTIKQARGLAILADAARSTRLAFYAELVFLMFPALLLAIAWAYEPALDGGFLFISTALFGLVLIYACLGVAENILAARRRPFLENARQIIQLGSIKRVIGGFLNFGFLCVMMFVASGSELLPYLGLMEKAVCWVFFFYCLLAVILVTMDDFRLRKKLASAHNADFPPILTLPNPPPAASSSPTPSRPSL